MALSALPDGRKRHATKCHPAVRPFDPRGDQYRSERPDHSLDLKAYSAVPCRAEPNTLPASRITGHGLKVLWIERSS